MLTTSSARGTSKKNKERVSLQNNDLLKYIYFWLLLFGEKIKKSKNKNNLLKKENTQKQ